MGYLLLNIVLLSGVINFYLLFRVNKVAEFRHYMIDLNKEWAKRNIEFINVYNDRQTWWLIRKYSMTSMLLSMKPLTLEAWFTDAEIKRLMS